MINLVHIVFFYSYFIISLMFVEYLIIIINDLVIKIADNFNI
jgi:hypothetical protein